MENLLSRLEKPSRQEESASTEKSGFDNVRLEDPPVHWLTVLHWSRLVFNIVHL